MAESGFFRSAGAGIRGSLTGLRAGVLTAAILLTGGGIGLEAGVLRGGPRPAQTGAVTPRASRAAARKLAATINGNGVFAFDMYRAVSSQSRGNLCFSPYNIGVAFGMVWVGARGETAEEIAEVFHFPEENGHVYVLTNHLDRSLAVLGPKIGFELDAGNAIWVDRRFPVLPSYLSLLRSVYRAECRQLDMRGNPVAVAAEVNRWVSRATRGRIPAILVKNALSAGTAMCVTSALYFYSPWQKPFDERATHIDTFDVPGTGKVKCRMMEQTDVFPYLVTGDLQVLDLPYRGNVFSMLIFLPAAGRSLARFERSLTFANVVRWVRELRRREVRVELPRFRIDAAMDLTQVLQGLGVRRAFSQSADFDGISTVGPLWIDAVLHGAVITVNERGTVAAAATAIPMAAGASSLPPRFRADHPFVFLLRERRTGAVLFLGRVMDPGRGDVTIDRRSRNPHR